VNAMLLNEFLKEHRKVEEQETIINRLKAEDAKQETTIAQQHREFQSTLARQQAEIEALTLNLKEYASQIRNVSEQLELSKPATKLALNNE
jgi:hypothetical protein